MQPWGAGDHGVLRWITPILGRFNEMLWHAVKMECYISIPQTGALLDFIPGTRYFDLFFFFFLVYGPLKLLWEGHKFPCEVNLKITDSDFNFLGHIFRGALSQQDPVTTEQTETAASQTPASTF